MNIKNKNNNFRCLSMQNEQINFNFKKISKFVLIMAIDDSSNIYYELTKKTNNKDTFLKFIQKVILKLNEKKPNNMYLYLTIYLATKQKSYLIFTIKKNKCAL